MVKIEVENLSPTRHLASGSRNAGAPTVLPILRLDSNLGAFLLSRKEKKMFIWNLVSITAGVIVLLVLLVVGYSIISGMIDGIKKSMKEGDLES